MPLRSVLNHGDVVLVPFPFTDLTAQKVRPAIIVSTDPQGTEIILAFITSVLTNHSPRGAEVALLGSDPDFRQSGLKVDSLIRLDKLVTLSSGMVSRRLGSLSPAIKGRVVAMLRLALGL